MSLTRWKMWTTTWLKCSWKFSKFSNLKYRSLKISWLFRQVLLMFDSVIIILNLVQCKEIKQDCCKSGLKGPPFQSLSLNAQGDHLTWQLYHWPAYEGAAKNVQSTSATSYIRILQYCLFRLVGSIKSSFQCNSRDSVLCVLANYKLLVC